MTRALGPIPDRRDAEVRLSEVLAGLSYALDMTEGQRPGHAVRTCMIGMRLAEILGLPVAQRSALFYALLMKDLGCSSNAARFAVLFGADDHRLKSDLKTVDWPRAIESFRYVARSVAPGQSWPRRVWQLLGVFAKGPEGARDVVRTRCERGADIARVLRFPNETVQAIRTIDEHWDGFGQPNELKGDAIPLLGRIVGLAQTVEVFSSTYDVHVAYAMAAERRGRWFDPAVVDALLAIDPAGRIWREIEHPDPGHIAAIEPPDRVIVADEDYLDVVAGAFAKVIDAKSPWTFRHSEGVSDIAGAMGARMGFDAAALRELRRAALLHDLGKLGVSNLILDKPDRLTEDEMRAVRRHPAQTFEILSRVGCFRHLADVAASHHERLDGRGYHRGIASTHLDTGARILCTADICDALRAPRPYRDGLPIERVLEIMSRQVGTTLDPMCFDAVSAALTTESAAPSNNIPAVRLVGALAEDYQQAA